MVTTRPGPVLGTNPQDSPSALDGEVICSQVVLADWQTLLGRTGPSYRLSERSSEGD